MDKSETRLDDAAIQEWRDKIFAAWGYDEDQLRRMSVEDILNKDDVPNQLLSTTKAISSDDAEDFAQKIKPYLDSTILGESFAGKERSRSFEQRRK